jgi:PAS domain S-box-containing protein
MNNPELAAVLLAFMPYAMGIRAVTFLAMMIVTADSRRRWFRPPSLLFFAIFLMSMLEVLMASFFAGRADPANIDEPIEWVLLVGLNIVPVFASIAAVWFVRWTQSLEGYDVSNEGVFGTLAQAMPIIVANSDGIIQHTTPAFDELARSGPGELVGKDLKEIMPERYRARHNAGMEHYVRTREARIVGTVVTVEMLRMDGTEVPVYLALNTTDVDGLPWFVAALWEKEPQTPETMISEYERVRSERQDKREDGLDQRALGLDKRGWDMSKESMKQEGQQRDLDTREHDVERREEATDT